MEYGVTSSHRARSLAALTSPDLQAGAHLLIVPLGSTEQHGPHLPLDTDTRIAVALAERLAAVRSDVVVAPAVAFGASGEHAGFAGTLSIGTDVMAAVVTELVRSAGPEFVGVVLVNGHGGNGPAVERATELCNYEGRPTLAWWPRVPGGDAHAGHTETSMLLAFAPEVVRTELAEAGDQRPLAEVIEQLQTGGVRAVSANGVLGDPTGASSEEGGRLLSALTADLVKAVTDRFGEVAA